MSNTLEARTRNEELDNELRAAGTGDLEPGVLLTDFDRKILEKYDELKRWSYGVDQTLIALEGGLSDVDLPESRLLNLVRNLRAENKEMAETLYAPIFEHSIRSLHTIHNLKLQLEQRVGELDAVHQRLNEIRSLPFYRLGSAAARRLRRLKPQHEDAAPPVVRPVSEEHSFYAADNPYRDVDNGGTPLSIFRNWVTLFHFQGRRLGASEPLVSDVLETINELHAAVPLAGRRVLELGPLEGGNTKQMIDLGALHVCGIEFNKELFLKCLVVKNAFRLDAAEFVFGDCNAVMDEPEFREREPFDMAVASGVLYHMEDPVGTIELLTKCAPVVYVWTHVASDRAPGGPWVQSKDSQGRIYRGRRNEYKAGDTLGGIGKAALWLTKESVQQAFEDRGYRVEKLGELQNYKGDAVKLIARRASAD